MMTILGYTANRMRSRVTVHGGELIVQVGSACVHEIIVTMCCALARNDHKANERGPSDVGSGNGIMNDASMRKPCQLPQ